SVCGLRFRAVAACEARKRFSDRESARARAKPWHRSDADRVRWVMSERGISRALSTRRSLPRYLAVQRAHDRKRCAMGRLPAALETAYLQMADQYRRGVREPFRVHPS